MFKKTLLFSAVTVLVAMLAGATAFATLDTWNRPNPLMDYVPQEMGIYDTTYDRLGELDCRACHGDSLADRHHYTEMVLRDRLCTPCHEICDITEPGCDNGVIVIRDCTSAGCHLFEATEIYANGWHHDTDMSGSENCTICHDSNLVAQITPFSSFVEYPPSVVTPTPFSCENCHWGQAVVDAQAGFNPTAGPGGGNDALAGHPSDFNHENQWGDFIGYYEYDKAIDGNHITHHMGGLGNVANTCWKCHGNDHTQPGWDPDDPELIRYCEICHDIATLHTIEPHVGPLGTDGGPAVEGWEAAGFNVPGSADGIPDVYRGNMLEGFGGSYFEANEMCFGCHGDNVPPYEGDASSAPVLSGVSPTAVCPTGLVELTGSFFGDLREPGEDYVEIRKTPFTSSSWIKLDSTFPPPEGSPSTYWQWTDSLIIFEVTDWEFEPGNYRVRVRTDGGATTVSSTLAFTIWDCVSPTEVNGNSNPAFDETVCKETISLTDVYGNASFGGVRDTTAAAGNTGIYRLVQVTASQGSYIALNYPLWSNPEVRFKFKDFFEDLDGDFFQDASEDTIPICEGLALGTYSVHIKYIFYIEDGTSPGYDDDDTMVQVETSNPVTVELVNDPFITAINPKIVERNHRFRIFGINFGPTQTSGEVHIGSGKQYNSDPIGKGKIQPAHRIKLWSNTKIAVKMRVPPAWAGTNKRVWVVKNGATGPKVSNMKRIEILP